MCLRPEVVLFGGMSVMAWGGMCGQEKTPVVIVNENLIDRRYSGDILRPITLPFLQQKPRGVIYQHDNTRSYIFRIVQNFVGANDVNVVSCPARSPEMSPTEHLWHVIVAGGGGGLFPCPSPPKVQARPPRDCKLGP